MISRLSMRSTSLASLPFDRATTLTNTQQIGGQRRECSNLCTCNTFGWRPAYDFTSHLSTISDKVSEVSRPVRHKDRLASQPSRCKKIQLQIFPASCRSHSSFVSAGIPVALDLRAGDQYEIPTLQRIQAIIAIRHCGRCYHRGERSDGSRKTAAGKNPITAWLRDQFICRSARCSIHDAEPKRHVVHRHSESRQGLCDSNARRRAEQKNDGDRPGTQYSQRRGL